MIYPARVLFIFWFTILVSGCSSDPEVKPEPETTLTLTIIAGFDINQTSLNTAAPLQARLYELQTPELFERADFLDIYLQDSAALQDTLVKKHSLPTIWPNTTTTLSFTLDKTTQYVAVFTEFARYKTAVPSAIYRIATQSDNVITLHISGDHVRLSGSQSSSQDSLPATTQDSENGS